MPSGNSRSRSASSSSAGRHWLLHHVEHHEGVVAVVDAEAVVAGLQLRLLAHVVEQRVEPLGFLVEFGVAPSPLKVMTATAVIRPMMTTTTMISISVKPRARARARRACDY